MNLSSSNETAAPNIFNVLVRINHQTTQSLAVGINASSSNKKIKFSSNKVA